MRKRERENPCGVCGHYHKHDELCGICGHRMPISSQDSSNPSPVQLISAFPSEILPDFLYLGSYDNASRSQLLKAQGISRILNTVASCQNLYKNNFVYHCLPDDKTLPFHEAFLFLEQCEREKTRVLVHCMSGKYRSPAIVIAYLMKSKAWRLAQSYQWVKDRRPSIDLSQSQPVYQQLQEYEVTLFGTADASIPTTLLASPPLAAPTPSFGFGKPSDLVSVPTFNNATTTSIFARSPVEHPLHEFTFGAGAGQEAINIAGASFSAQQQNCSDVKNNSMDSS